MRLAERTLCEVYLAPRVELRGEMGGMAEAFSDERIPLRASVLPDEGALSTEGRGCVNRERLRLLAARDAGVSLGDGVWVNGSLWRILAVKKWIAHQELVCEAVS